MKYTFAIAFAVVAVLFLLASLGGDPGAAMPRSILIIPAIVFAVIAAVIAVITYFV